MLGDAADAVTFRNFSGRDEQDVIAGPRRAIDVDRPASLTRLLDEDQRGAGSAGDCLTGRKLHDRGLTNAKGHRLLRLQSCHRRDYRDDERRRVRLCESMHAANADAAASSDTVRALARTRGGTHFGKRISSVT